MKAYLIIALFLVTSLTNCSTMQNKNNHLQKEAPFTVVEALHISNENAPYTILSIKKTNPEIVLDEVYFLDKKLKLKLDAGSYIAKINTIINKDLILHSDPKKEYGNTPPVVEKIPFKLKDNEAVVSYKIKGIVKYYKLKVIHKIKE